MFDIVLPEDNELELIRMAERLGWKRLCLAYGKHKDISRFRQQTSIGLLSGIIGDSGSADLIIAKTSDPDKTRSLAERSRINIITGLEASKKHDFMHHRNSGLNHVICRILAENDIVIAFDFSSILDSKGRQRAILLGRMKQNARFARKYKIGLIFASFASSPLGMRSPRLASSFLSTMQENI
ncbi:MAG: RNase P subunit p30 family protein [Candidatus Nanoarchaeia archaeon]